MEFCRLQFVLNDTDVVSGMIAGEGPHVCYIVGPGSFYLRGLSELSSLFTFVAFDGIWARQKTSQENERSIQEISLSSLLRREKQVINQLKKHFNCTQVGLMGFSAPGALALKYARDYPNDIAWVIGSGLALCKLDAAFSATDKVFKEKARSDMVKKFNVRQMNYQKLKEGSPDAKALPAARFFKNRHKRSLTPNSDYMEQVYLLMPKLVYDQQHESACLEHWRENPRGDVLNQCMREHFFKVIQPQLDALQLLQELKETVTPILLINGQEDFITPMDEVAKDLVKKCPNVTLAAFDACGHMPYIEKPKAFYQAIRNFISSLNNTLPLVPHVSFKLRAKL